MLGNGIKALVVEHSQQTGIGRHLFAHLPRRSLDGQLPLLLLTRSQTVAEGCPLHPQFFVGHGATDDLLVRVTLTIFDPRIGQQQPIAILLTLSQLAIDEFTALLGSTTL